MLSSVNSISTPDTGVRKRKQSVRWFATGFLPLFSWLRLSRLPRSCPLKYLAGILKNHLRIPHLKSSIWFKNIHNILTKNPNLELQISNVLIFLFLIHSDRYRGYFITQFLMQRGFFLSPFNNTHITMAISSTDLVKETYNLIRSYMNNGILDLFF